MLRPLVVCLFLVLGVYGLKKEDAREITLEGLGTIKGLKYWDGDFHEFYGIPYALAPVGRDRYKAPLPPVPWEKTMEANKGIYLCQQVYFSNDDADAEEEFLAGLEDCLISHIMVPKIATETNPVPVVVFIHSGGFAGGSASMAKYHKVAQQNVITVALNYRVGAVGFACLGTESVPGNAGLKDLVAGLKWVNKHIKSFGGDPNKVTLAGFSVGAALAELIALTKEADGLFQKLMLDSGSALMPFAVNRNPIDTARNIAKASGFEDSGTIKDLEEFLLESDLKPLQAHSRNFFLKNSTFGFAPCIENSKLPGALLTESPYDTLKKGNYAKLSVLTGFSNMEGISRTSQFEKWSKLMNENLAEFLPVDLKFSNDKDRDTFIKDVKQKYFKGEEVSLDTLQGYIDYFSDSMFKYGLMRSAKLHAARNPIYLYEFTYVGKLNTRHGYQDRIFGASHRDASAYVLDFYDWTRNYTDMDHSNRMVFMWTDLIKYDNPTAFESSLLKTKWQKYTNEQPNYLDIGYDLVNKKNLFADSYKFWDKVYQNNYWTPSAPNPEAYKPTVSKSAKPEPVAAKATPAAPPTDEKKAVPKANEPTESKAAKQEPVAAKATPAAPPAGEKKAVPKANESTEPKSTKQEPVAAKATPAAPTPDEKVLPKQAASPAVEKKAVPKVNEATEPVAAKATQAAPTPNAKVLPKEAASPAVEKKAAPKVNESPEPVAAKAMPAAPTPDAKVLPKTAASPAVEKKDVPKAKESPEPKAAKQEPVAAKATPVAPPVDEKKVPPKAKEPEQKPKAATPPVDEAIIQASEAKKSNSGKSK